MKICILISRRHSFHGCKEKIKPLLHKRVYTEARGASVTDVDPKTSWPCSYGCSKTQACFGAVDFLNINALNFARVCVIILESGFDELLHALKILFHTRFKYKK